MDSGLGENDSGLVGVLQDQGNLQGNGAAWEVERIQSYDDHACLENLRCLENLGNHHHHHLVDLVVVHLHLHSKES